MMVSTRPTVLTEGETDRDYVRACLQTLGLTELSSAIEIDWVGTNVDGVAQRGGKDALDTVAKAFKANIGLLQAKLLLLYDCDGGRRSETLGDKLFIRSIEQSPDNAKFKRGIENLLPESLARREFYDVRTDDKYGGEIQVLNKRRLCDWVVGQKDPGNFVGFEPVLRLLRELAGIAVSSPTSAQGSPEVAQTEDSL